MSITQSSFQGLRGLLVFTVFILVGLGVIFLPGLDNALVFDDERLVDGSIFGKYGDLALSQRVIAYSSFVWIQDIFGSGWWKQRIFNLLIHVLVVFSLYGLWRQITERVVWEREAASVRGESTQGLGRSGCMVGVLLFAFNPMSVYAVAYLIQRSILLATLFSVFGLYSFCRWVTRGQMLWLLVALVCYPLAVLSKEYALFVPVLALLLFIFIRQPHWKKLLPSFAVASMLFAVVVAVLYQRYAHLIGEPFDELSVVYIDQLKALNPDIEKQAWILSILNQATLFFYYGFLWMVPNVFWMSVDMRTPFPAGIGSWYHLLGALAYISLLISGFWLLFKHGRKPLGLLGLSILFPSVLFMTEFATVWIQDPFVLYRSYLWAIALPGLVAFLFIGVRPPTVWAVGGIVATLFAGLAVERVLSFRTPITVWNDAIAKIDRAASLNAVGRWRAYLNRGLENLNAGLPELALADFRAMANAGERHGLAQFNMALALQQLNRHAEALQALKQAESLGYPLVHQLWHVRGESLYRVDEYKEAYTAFSRSIEKLEGDKRLVGYRLRRGEAALVIGENDVARSDFEHVIKAIKVADSAERVEYLNRAMIGLGMTHLARKEPERALPYFNDVLKKGENADARYGKALVFEAQDMPGLAMGEIQSALRQNGTNPNYRELLKRVQAALPREPRQPRGAGPAAP